MQIRNFNHSEASLAPAASLPSPSDAVRTVPPEASPATPAGDGGNTSAEMALLRARIEHLELVVETARNLMTSNQDRLLRRLHDLPHEMMTLAATLARYAPTTVSETTGPTPLRSVQ